MSTQGVDSPFVRSCESVEDAFRFGLDALTKDLTADYQQLLLFDSKIPQHKVGVFRQLFELPSDRDDLPLVRMVGIHTFTHDRVRTSRIISPSEATRRRLLEFADNVDPWSLPDMWLHEAFDHLFMLAYRQIFKEHLTLNAWMLRSMQMRGMRLELASGAGGPFLRQTVSIQEPISDVLDPTPLLRLVCPIVLKSARAYFTAAGRSNRFAIAATMHARIRDLLPQISAWQVEVARAIREKNLSAGVADGIEQLTRVLGLPSGFEILLNLVFWRVE